MSRIAARKKMEAALNSDRAQRPRHFAFGRAVFAFCVAGFGAAAMAWILAYHLAIFAASHNICDPTARCASWFFLLVIAAFMLCGIAAAVFELGDSIRPKLKSRRTAQIALGAVVALVGLYYLPLFSMNIDQDECAFGPVSKARYREFLDEAMRRQATTWPALVWDNNKTMALLSRRVADLSAGSSSDYERLAAMHAVMRALGGDYRRTRAMGASRVGRHPFGGASYEYEVDLNGLGFFSPFRRQLWVIGQFIFDKDAAQEIAQDHERALSGYVDFIVWFPALLETYIVVPRSLLGESCPRLPNEVLAERSAR